PSTRRSAALASTSPSGSAAISTSSPSGASFRSVLPLHGDVGAHLDLLVVEADGAVLLAVGERVLEPVVVVAERVVLPVVTAAALVAREGARDERLGAVEQEPELEGLHQFGVVDL